MLSGLLKELKIAAVPHGFRSSFRDSAAEETNHSREVAEAALAHAVRNPVEAAYRRTDLFERRRRLMEELGSLPQWGTQRRLVSALAAIRCAAWPMHHRTTSKPVAYPHVERRDVGWRTEPEAASFRLVRARPGIASARVVVSPASSRFTVLIIRGHARTG